MASDTSSEKEPGLWAPCSWEYRGNRGDLRRTSVHAIRGRVTACGQTVKGRVIPELAVGCARCRNVIQRQAMEAPHGL